MRILIALTYYRPHYSGLTIYAERLARALAQRGHQVTVLTSQYNRNLPQLERLDGVQVQRLPVKLRISKGVIMPSMPIWAWRLIRQVDAVNLHVPQLDAALLSLIGRLLRKPVVLTYHCDLRLPRGLVHSLANLASNLANHITASLAQQIVTNSRDYAEHSPFLRRYLQKVIAIPPPIAVAEVGEAEVLAFRQRYHIRPGDRVIGMAARFAAEKGVETLVAAMPHLLTRFPTVKVLFVGQYQNVLGEEAYAAKLTPLIQQLGEHWQFLGVLPPEEFAAFLKVAEVTVLPSTNSTESYGMVQVESMLCGTPVVASDLPGVRQPVLSSGMGRIVPVHDAEGLAKAIGEILEQPQCFQVNTERIRRSHDPQVVAEQYEQIFTRLLSQA
ncbi:MAG: glycosyltransferase family 4 protein [Anaerolineales bacterium]|nr:glycosyltransferase family 4 protein [Anaerolineales bacterium]MDW8162940.1 glycosyltransferase family 4 protein [Anaerolineales bacterium]